MAKTPVPDKQGGNREKVGPGRPPKSSQFKPGQSGNPKGRPKGKTVSERMRDMLQEVDPATGEIVAEMIARRMVEAAMNEGGLAWIVELLDRTEGKPKTTDDIGNKEPMAPVKESSYVRTDHSKPKQ
jgi:hypothetical protein